MSRLRLSLFFLLYLAYIGADAQSHVQYMDLASYLENIEEDYAVIFSYADENTESIVVEYQEYRSLNAHLDYLKNYTPFKYKVQKDNTILVIPLTNTKVFCIKIIDQITKQVVSDAIISQDNYRYRSDENGELKLTANKEALSIKLEAEDYITRESSLENITEECSIIYINPFYQTLDEVFLSNLFTRGIQKITSGGLEINYEEFGLLPGLVEPDVLQSLQALPGIISRRESVSYLNVRGGTHDQNLFLWDGIKMYNTSHFFGMISAFNPYLTQSLKLVKNGTSAKFGDGVSSLINMRTSNTITDSLKTSIGINFLNADALIKIPLTKTSSVEFSSRHSINTLWESPTYTQYFDKVFQNTEVTNFETSTSQQNNRFTFFDATINYKLQFSDKDFLKLNFIYAEDDFSLNRFDIEDTPINTRTSNLGKTNTASGAFYKRQWNTSTTSELQFYISEYALQAVNTNLRNQQGLEQKNQVNEIGFKLNVKTRINPNVELDSGYQFNETGTLNSQRINDPEFFNEDKNAIITNSLYTQLNYQSANNLLNLILGGRLNHYSKFDKIIAEPRFNLSYQFIDNLFLEILAEQKSQVTSQIVDLQTDFLGVENRRWVLSHPENRPIIESQQVSAGLNFVKPEWFINLDFYYKNVEGITSQGQGFQNQFEFTQTHGSYEVKGFDILINKNFEPFSGWASYSLSENKYSFNALSPSSFHNNLDIRHVIAMGLSYEKKGFKLSSGFNWHSGATATLARENQEELPQAIQYESPNAVRLNDYFRLDISSTYTFSLFKTLKSVAGVSFLNVLNTNNIYNQFYLITQEENIQSFKQNALGFTPNLMFRLNF